jgi:hypothetical protein
MDGEMNDSFFEDIRAVIGVTLGTSRLDRELIRDAFVLGAGAATGIAIRLLDIGDEEAEKLSVYALDVATQIVEPYEDV